MQLKANEVIKYLKYLVSVSDYNQIRKKKSNFNIPEKKNTWYSKTFGNDELSQTVLMRNHTFNEMMSKTLLQQKRQHRWGNQLTG